MKIKQTLVAISAAAALSVAMVSAVSAAPPMVEGYLTCEKSWGLDYLTDWEPWTKKDIAAYRRDNPEEVDGCAGGSFAVTQVPLSSG